MNPRRFKPAAVGFLIAAVIVIAAATLTPRISEVPGVISWCIVCGELGGIDFVNNVLLFLPLGVGLAWSRVPGSRAVLIGVGFTVAIETAQLTLISGRAASLGDLLANTIGTGLGWGAVAGWRGWWWPSAPATAGNRSLVWAAVAALAVAAGGWLLTPGYSQAAWYGQVRPELGHLDRFTGSVSGFRLNDLAVAVAGTPSHPAGGSTVSLTGRVTRPASLTSRIAPILSVFDANQTEQVLLGQRSDQLVFRARTRASRWGLQGISVGLPGVFGAAPPGDFDAMGTRRDAELIVAATENQRTRATRLRLTPALAWTTILPIAYVHRSALTTTAISILWLLGLAAPLGWFASRRVTTVIAAGLVVAALGLPAIVSGLAVPGPFEWSGLVVGWGLGWWARRK